MTGLLLSLRYVVSSLLILFCWGGLVFPSFAEEFRATAVEQPETQPVVVYGISQDQQDFLWLAAEFDGLLRFDGQQYLRFAAPSPQQHLSYSQVVTDQHNQLWIGTWGDGVWQLDALRKHWQQVTGLEEKAQVQALKISSTGTLWVGTTHGLYQRSEAQQQATLWPALKGIRIWHIAEQNDGTLWVGTSKGLYLLRPTDASQSHWFEHPDLTNTEIRAVAIHDQQVLIGLRAHVGLLHISAPSQLQLLDLGNPNHILAEGANSWLVGSIDGLFQVHHNGEVLSKTLLHPATDIRRLYRDRRGKLWMSGRNSGLFSLPAMPLKLIQPDLSSFLSPIQPHRLGPASFISSRWQALERTLLRVDAGQWQEIPFRSELPVSYARDVVEFGQYTLAATDQGLFQLRNQAFVSMQLPMQPPRFNVERMALAPDGALWLGLWEQGVLRIDASAAQHDIAAWRPQQLQPQAQPLEGIIDIRTDPKQRLWLLSRQGKLYLGRPNGIDLKWQAPATLSSGYFQCMLPEGDIIWLCTDRGLIRLSDNLTTVTQWGTAEGLPDQRVIGITRTANYLWILTRSGVLRANPDGSQLHLLAPRPGMDLTSAQLNGINPYKDNQVQVATSTGIWVVSPSDMTAVPNDMQLHLTSLRINRQLYNVADTSSMLKLTDDVHELQLQFKLLTFQPHLQVQYFFRWQPQSQWTSLGSDATLTLSQLKPGLHRLEVMAQAGGQQIRSQLLQLQVPIPWWQRPLGLIALGFCCSFLLWTLYRLRTKHLEQRAAKLDQLVMQRTAELEQANEQLRVQSNTDSLTGLLNRRALYAAADLLQAQRRRTGAALTLVLIDIDHFKAINDTLGHDSGDSVLKQVAFYFKQQLRGQDLIARWGGEEFLLLMPDTDMTAAMALLEELRMGIRQIQLPKLPYSLSATFGLSEVGLDTSAFEQALKAADKALYQGKAQGRDQVVRAVTQALA